MYRFLHCVVLFLMFSTTAFCGTQRTISDALPFEDDEDTTMECFKDTWADNSTKRRRDKQRRIRHRIARSRRLNRKCENLLEKTACSWVERAMYKNEKGSVILDAKLCKKALENDIVATCVDCQETFKFCEIYEHYKKTNHRFFYNVRPYKG